MTEVTEKSIYEKTLQEIINSQDVVDDQYKKVGNAATTNCDINQVVPQIQNMEIVRNRGGQVIGYDYKYTTPRLPDANIIEVDSNTDSGEYGSDGFGEAAGGGGHSSGGGAGRTRNYVGTVDTDPESTDKLKSGGLVSGLISSAYAGVSALAKLGKNVMATTGDALADYTEAISQNFSDFLVDAGNITGDAIRALFGVDSQGNTTMYLDEDTIGALAITAKEKGFFDESGGSSIDTPTNPNWINTFDYPLTYYTETGNWIYNGSLPNNMAGYVFMIPWVTYNYVTYLRREYICIFTNNFSVPVTTKIAIIKNSTGTSYNVVLLLPDDIDTSLQIGTYTEQYTNNEWIPFTTSTYAIRTYTYNQQTAKYIYATSSNYQNIDIYYSDFNKIKQSTFTFELRGIMAWEMRYGESYTPTVIPGVSTQPGATVPVDAITGADPHVVAQNLADNYSQIMGAPVLINVMDDSCNETTIKYYSVPISYSPTNLNVAAPITGGLQVSPSFNPDVQLELPDIDLPNFINQVTKIINGSGAGKGITIEPEINISPEFPLGPDTPSDQIPQGSLPVVIPQTGVGETPESTLPVAAPTTLWHVYNPSPAEISAFGQWLWAGGFNIETLRKILQNPMDAVIGLHAIYGTPHVSGSAAIVCGNIESPVSARVVSSQYTSVDCGEVLLSEYFGNVFDYDPYTKISLYLPFIGIVPLDTADTMRATIGVKYNIDVFTGACNAQVIVTRDGAGGVLYQFAGNCAVAYPISGATYNNIFSSTIGISMGIAMVASGVGAAYGLSSALYSAESAFKTNVARASSFSGNAGAMGSKIPYLIITRPQTEMAIKFEEFDGIPANKQIRLSDCSGYTKCKEVHLNVSGAYKSELDEIERLLRIGVIF